MEYQELVTNISQQAANIGLNANGTLNTVNSVYIGGGGTPPTPRSRSTSAAPQNQVDAAGLGIANTSVLGGGTELTGNTVRLDAPGASFLNGATQTFTFNLISNNAATAVTATVERHRRRAHQSSGSELSEQPAQSSMESARRSAPTAS